MRRSWRRLRNVQVIYPGQVGIISLNYFSRLSDLSFLYPRSISFDSNRFYLNKLKLYRYESVISFDLIVFCRRFQVEALGTFL